MAYAAITSLMTTMEQSLQSKRTTMRLLHEKLDSLRATLEEPWKITSHIEALTSLEAQITELSLRAQDMVDSKSRKFCLAQTAKKRRRALWKLRFHLRQAVQDIDSIMKKWMAIRNRYNNIRDVTTNQPQNTAHHISHHAASEPENMIVGHENEFEIMLDQLARGSSELEVVSIVGMGGIGKTTLAIKLYNDPFIMSHFDIRAKTTVSQEYCRRNVLLGLLSCTAGNTLYLELNEGELADRLQKILKGKRYLIVIDDIWTTTAWDDFKLCFPDYHNKSRILLTTRHMEVAEYACSGVLKLRQLRNLHLDWNYLTYYYNEPRDERRLVLENLQCLIGWNPLNCTLSLLRLLPNLRKLKIYGTEEDYRISSTQKVFHNLCYLDQLETLKFEIKNSYVDPPALERCPSLVLPPPGAFPQNLKKLAFTRTCLSWEDLNIVGKLPKLEVLKLAYNACEGEEWEVIEEGFPQLKKLLLKCINLKYWKASSNHFPCLEQLFLQSCGSLDSIPQDFADIMTLELIDISSFQKSLLNSAYQIQQDIGENVLQVRVSQPVKWW